MTSRPIRVLHLRDTTEIGGPGKTILETHRAISDGFRLHLGVFQTRRETGETPFVEAARRCGLPIHHLTGFNQYDPRLIWRVAALVRQLRIDIVHAHETKSDVIALLARRLQPVRLVTTVHGWIANSRRDARLVRLDKRVIRKFDCSIAVSSNIAQQLCAAGVPSHKVKVLHNAIALDGYSRTGDGGMLRGLLGNRYAPPIIACLGRLSPEKGQEDLVEALGLLSQRGLRPTVVIAGDGPLKDTLAERVRVLGLSDSVHLVGHVNDPRRFLDEVHLLVLPSHTEGLPNVVLEAFAMQLPVLATRVGGTPEIITHGETGRLVEPHSPEALADGLQQFLTAPAEWAKFGNRGRAEVESRFNFRKRTASLERIYADLMVGCRS